MFLPGLLFLLYSPLLPGESRESRLRQARLRRELAAYSTASDRLDLELSSIGTPTVTPASSRHPGRPARGERLRQDPRSPSLLTWPALAPHSNAPLVYALATANRHCGYVSRKTALIPPYLAIVEHRAAQKDGHDAHPYRGLGIRSNRMRRLRPIGPAAAGYGTTAVARPTPSNGQPIPRCSGPGPAERGHRAPRPRAEGDRLSGGVQPYGAVVRQLRDRDRRRPGRWPARSARPIPITSSVTAARLGARPRPWWPPSRRAG